MSDTPTPPDGEDTGDTAQTWTIKSPNSDYNGLNSSVQFRDGQGVTDKQSVALRFESKGYTVTEGGELETNQVPQSIKPTPLAAPSSRDAAVLGKAAQGPLSDAFMPPVGAGEGKDPHGTEVASPGLHAVPPAPILPGEVSRDPDEQEAKESEAAQAVLIESQSLEDFQGGPDFLGDEDNGEAQPTGPLEMSDPASEGQGPDAADEGDGTPEGSESTAGESADEPRQSESNEGEATDNADQTETSETGEPVQRPAGNASKDAWVEYAVANGMSREEAELLSRSGIQERFPEEG